MSIDNSDHREAIISQLVLDVKALVLLSDNDEELSEIVRRNILNSHDEQISKFATLMVPPKPVERQRGRFLTAIGELVLASFLTIAGLSLMAPSLMGLQSPNQLLAYFSEIVSGISASSFSNPLIPALDFLFALLLLLGSFYLLRHASNDMKSAGLS